MKLIMFIDLMMKKFFISGLVCC